MQMKNEKLLLLIILIVVTLIISIININMLSKVIERVKYLNRQEKLKEESEKLSKEFYENSGLKEINNITSFFTVKLCTEKYFETLNSLWYNTEYTMNDSYNKYSEANKYEFEFSDFRANVLNDILAQKYKKEFNVDKESIKEKYKEHFIQDKIIISKVYEYNMNKEITAFIVNGYNFCENGSNKKSFSIMILIDLKENTFEIYPEEYLERHNLNNIDLDKKITAIEDIKKINKNDNNKTPSEIVTNEKIVDYYLDLYKFNIKYNIEMAYEMLEEKYREKRFGTFDNYKNYINDNQDKYIIVLDKYKVENINGYKQYMCIDKKGNYYIFTPEGQCLDYNLSLDLYTIDSLEFMDKYYKSDEPEKVALNIQKVFEALNSKDYNYVYNKLAESFKKEHFSKLEDFEDYAKKNFFETNEVEYLGYTKESEEYYSYIIKIKDKNSKETKGLKIIMKLEDGTDFIMSFNLE